MANRFGNLGELFPTTEVKCRVRGCENRIQVSGEEVIQKLARGRSGRPEKMCDECYARLQTLSDKEVPCSTPGCDGTFTWNRYQQLEAIVRAKGGEPQPPRGLCPKCRAAAGELQDQQRPCRLRGCKGTWTWTAREQQMSGGRAPAPRLCEDCYKLYRELQDKTVPCRIKGCKGTVVWTKYQQLEHLRAGKSLDNLPPRMCEDCFRKFSTLKNEERPCKIKGCKGTWTLSAYEQLEVIRNTPEGEEPVMPTRMCHDCFDFYTHAKDMEIPCRNHGCKNTWTWTRSMQLGARIRGNKRPPERLCEACVKELMLLHDEERPCSVPGCHGTWTYRAEEQLRDKCAGREEPRRRCVSCRAFLQNHQAEELTCASCGKTFSWSVQEQLACHLGEFVRPTKCPDCVAREISSIKTSDPVPLVMNRMQIRIPSTGAWSGDMVIRDWPVRMDRHVLSKLSDCGVRVVCIGDEMTLSVEESQSWPFLLEGKVSERLASCGRVGFVNAGIAGCTTAQGVARFQRDVAPFKPQLVVFSFAFSDARLAQGEVWDEGMQSLRLERLTADLERFIALSQEQSIKLLCWLPNPIFPQDCPEGHFDAEQFKVWCERQSQFYDLVQSLTRKVCERHGVQVVDARSLFEVNGVKSAQKWMRDWFMHNETGAMNIANWLMDRIMSSDLLSESDFPVADSPQVAAAPVAEASEEVSSEPETEPSGSVESPLEALEDTALEAVAAAVSEAPVSAASETVVESLSEVSPDSGAAPSEGDGSVEESC